MKKQFGAIMSFDFIIFGTVLIIAFSLIATLSARGNAKFNQARTLMDVSEIHKAADSWRGMRASYNGVSIEELCKTGYSLLSGDICSTNRYGGAYTLQQDTNSSYLKLTINNVNPKIIRGLADKLAPTSVEQCTSADACPSIEVKDSAIILTLG